MLPSLNLPTNCCQVPDTLASDCTTLCAWIVTTFRVKFALKQTRFACVDGRLIQTGACHECIDGKAGDDGDFDLSQLRLHVWSTPHAASSSHAAGTTTRSLAGGDEVVENQLMYMVLGTVLGVVVLVVVVCIAACTWRHQQQPARAVGKSTIYLPLPGLCPRVGLFACLFVCAFMCACVRTSRT